MELKPTDIDCMLISHHHGDHGGGVEIAMKKWDIPVKCNYFTAEKLGILDKKNLEIFESLDRIEVLSDVTFLPVTSQFPYKTGLRSVIFWGKKIKKKYL